MAGSGNNDTFGMLSAIQDRQLREEFESALFAGLADWVQGRKKPSVNALLFAVDLFTESGKTIELGKLAELKGPYLPVARKALLALHEFAGKGD